MPLSKQLTPHFSDAVEAVAHLPNPLNLTREKCISLGSFRTKFWLTTLAHMAVVSRRGDWQNLANRLDPVRIAVLVDETHHFFSGRCWPRTLSAAECPWGASLSLCEKRGRLTKNLVGSLQLAVLSLELLDARLLVAGWPRPFAFVSLLLAHPNT